MVMEVSSSSKMSPSRPQCPFSRPQNLTNFESTKAVTDVLHMKSNEGGVCSESVCNGSLMNIRKMSLEIRPPSEVMTQAKEFLEEYYKDIKGLDSQAHQTRLKEVTSSITRRGTYDLTYDELNFGAKMAWRNAPRCIGRISWNKLHLIDARHIKTAKEMFDIMLQHLDYASNKGNIRSAISVFPQRKKGQLDFRVWNQQLVSFAGYEQPDGTVIGDPAYKDFTKLCQNMGWKGKGGRFDVLPWVVSTPTGETEWFDVPEDDVLFVHIRHPEHKAFQELNLKWFAVPAVSNMMFDCGGIQFPAAPFNGWYMASEIGTRDFCDVQRYNLLQEIGENLGLDTKTPTNLWKDKATLEINVAVLHSFKEMGVTIVDHHTASETFMQFHSNEYRQRGGCPADWIWIVPPISGSLTPVYHQEMSLYYLKPAYEYQIPGWIAVEKQAKMLSGETGKQLEKPIKIFKKAALAVTFASTLYAGALAKRIRITILYASETGKAQAYANSLSDTFSQQFNPKVSSMGDYDVSRLGSERLVAILGSTTGAGEPPQNGKEFTKNLYELREKNQADGYDENGVTFWDDYNDVKVNGINTTPAITSNGRTVENGQTDEKKLLNKRNRGRFARFVRRFLRKRRYDMDNGGITDTNNISNMFLSSDNLNKSSNNLLKSSNNLYKSSFTLGRSTNSLFRILDPASDILYSVFALGSTNYKYFCAYGKYIDNLMFTLGGERIMDIACGDETDNQQDAFNEWSAHFLEECCDRFQLDKPSPSGIPLPKQITNEKQVKVAERSNQQPIAKVLSTLHGKDIETSTVLANTNLYQDHDKWYRQITTTLKHDSTLQYQPGDHVGILPWNRPAMVQGILLRLTNCPNPDVPVQVMLQKSADEDSWVPHPGLPVSSLRTLLQRSLDITTPPSQTLLRVMANSASGSHSSRLETLAMNDTEYRHWKKYDHLNLLEVLNEFSSVSLDAGLLLCHLPVMQPRMYSISSSPEVHEGQLTLTVASFSYKTQGGRGSLHQGVCTSYLKNLRPGNAMELYHRSAPEFHLPKEGLEGRAPILLIGAGSGAAPLRGFWQHYYHLSKKYTTRGPIRDMTLYYGCQTKASDLYATEKIIMKREKILKNVYLALSRDDKTPKTYVQDLLRVHSKEVYKQLMVRGGHVYICGSEQMADGVTESLMFIFQNEGKMSQAKARNIIQGMKEDSRYHEDIFGSGSSA